MNYISLKNRPIGVGLAEDIVPDVSLVHTTMYKFDLLHSSLQVHQYSDNVSLTGQLDPCEEESLACGIIGTI